jgi:hypothetical protein
MRWPQDRGGGCAASGPVGVGPQVLFVAQLTGQRIHLFLCIRLERVEIARRFRFDLLEPLQEALSSTAKRGS